MTTFLYVDHYDYQLSGERQRFKGDKQWYIKCEECDDKQWYPVQEHKAWHFLYDNMEELEYRARCTAEELRNLLETRTFRYNQSSTDGYSFKVSLRVPKPKSPEGAER